MWPQAAIDYAADSGEQTAGAPAQDADPGRWLPVECAGARQGYRDMEIFIDTLTDLEVGDRLRVAIHGRGAFRRFKDVLACTPDELDRWFAFAEERQHGRARAWLADAGYQPLATSPPPAG